MPSGASVDQVIEGSVMSSPSYEQLIIEGIKGLPPDVLVEIGHFVMFARMRTMAPDILATDMYSAGLHAELRQLSRNEERHLLGELEGCDRFRPGG